MTLAAEILLAEIAARPSGAVYLSGGGEGAPLLDEADPPPARIALSPLGGGFVRGGHTTLIRPLSLGRAPGDCARLAARAPLVLDATAADAETLIAAAGMLGPIAALRLRGGGSAPEGMVPALTGDDALFLAPDCMSAKVAARAAALCKGEVDQFDTLTAMARGDGGLVRLEYAAAGARLYRHPVAALDRPDAGQRAAALGAAQAVVGETGRCALILPQYGGASAAGVTVRGLPPGAPDPVLRLANPGGWRSDARRDGGRWSARLSPEPGAAARVSLPVDLHAQAGVDVTEVWTEISRPRAAWEIWDEAEALRAMEESW